MFTPIFILPASPKVNDESSIVKVPLLFIPLPWPPDVIVIDEFFIFKVPILFIIFDTIFPLILELFIIILLLFVITFVNDIFSVLIFIFSIVKSLLFSIKPFTFINILDVLFSDESVILSVPLFTKKFSLFCSIVYPFRSIIIFLSSGIVIVSSVFNVVFFLIIFIVSPVFVTASIASCKL